MAKHITDRAARGLRRVADKASDSGPQVAGPSPNPATNAIIHDVILRSAGRLTRMTVEKTLLRGRYGSSAAKQMVENRSTLHALAAYGVTKLATRSVPGALLVGGGLLAKTIFDRSIQRRSAKRRGDAMLEMQADEDAPI
ncbi:hypothetical protein [Paraurantiacibacter namhicola]|uniref:Uncharacterized protein n=1 Tax=Paraurantiacibacter namhicola TaxID=645517 RepID=A0A1C7D736_9SPHN|nr:hypothetical protein [Paraurantiacibacter namhicola]ANU07290.1 hypothetical protein A6F65_00980 [Paraurantiacibacter namhicola]